MRCGDAAAMVACIVRRIPIYIVPRVFDSALRGEIVGADIKISIGMNGPGYVKGGARLELKIVIVKYRVGPWIIEPLLENAPHLGRDRATVGAQRRNRHVDSSKIIIAILPG